MKLKDRTVLFFPLKAETQGFLYCTVHVNLKKMVFKLTVLWGFKVETKKTYFKVRP